MTSTRASIHEWAESEYGSARLGHKRRTDRLVAVAAALATKPQGTLAGAFPAWAEAKGAYRLLENEAVTFEGVFDPHRQRVRQACRQPGEYLMVEDTTALDFTSHLAARDLGRIGDGGGRGLYAHSTLAMRVERWTAQHEPEVTVEGLFDLHWWARTGPSPGSAHEAKRKRLNRPRESQRWARVCVEVPAPAQARWTLLADREGDIYEVFQRCEEGGWEFIVRASQPRALADEAASVFEAVAQSPELGRFSIDLRARPGQSARQAVLAVRARTVTLRAPWRPGGTPPTIALNVVEAREVDAPHGCAPIHWVLLTDWPCERFEEAMRVVKAYTRRWLIEEYHMVLKSGTGIEDSQLETAQRITSLLGILSVVAVRLLNLRQLARTRPDDRPDPLELGPEALVVLEMTYGQPPGGWTYETAVRCIARLGGFLARKSDGAPGCKTLWRGLDKLMWMIQGYELARSVLGNDKGEALG